MQNVEVIDAVTLLALLLNTCIAVAAFVRVGKWRNSEDGKKVQDRLTALESATATDDGQPIRSDVHRIKNSLMEVAGRLGHVEKATDKIGAIEGRLASIDTDMKHMARRADITELKSEVGGVEDQVRAAAAGVKRIEDFLLARPA